MWNISCILHQTEVFAMIGVLGWVVFGLIVGVIAKFLMPGRDPGGIIVTMLLGIVGAVLGGFIGRALGMYGPNQGAGMIMSIVGAILVLAVYRLLAGGRTV
jgi:uncharacterized membrane protein YeaQ/YmgE (transglycosylase-associated protein family)